MTDNQIIITDLPEPRYTLFDSTREGVPEVVVVNEALLGFRHIDVFGGICA